MVKPKYFGFGGLLDPFPLGFSTWSNLGMLGLEARKHVSSGLGIIPSLGMSGMNTSLTPFYWTFLDSDLGFFTKHKKNIDSSIHNKINFSLFFVLVLWKRGKKQNQKIPEWIIRRAIVAWGTIFSPLLLVFC